MVVKQKSVGVIGDFDESSFSAVMCKKHDWNC